MSFAIKRQLTATDDVPVVVLFSLVALLLAARGFGLVGLGDLAGYLHKRRHW
jgi:hypothetical protein